MKDNAIRALIDAKKSGRRVAAVDFIASNPEIPAVLSKLIKSVYPTKTDSKGNREISDIDQSTMREASGNISQKSKDADLMMELFPEMELSSQILISSVISPKDMNSTEVNFTLPSNLKVSPLATNLLPVIKEYFEKSYKIEPLLPKILYDNLFGSGSYPIAVIPENSVDDLINGNAPVSMESLKALATDDGTFRPIGILGSALQDKRDLNFSIESLSKQKHVKLQDSDRVVRIENNNKTITFEHLTITDNFNTLKLPKIVDRVRKENIDNLLMSQSASLESFQTFTSVGNNNKLNDQQLSELFYKNKNVGFKNIVKVKTDAEVGRSMIGEPLVLKLPSESVIPVYTPGNEEKHIGYFVLLDSEGNPVSRNSTAVMEQDLRGRMNMNNDMSSFLLNQAARNFDTKCDSVTFRQASRVYADIIEADLLARLRNGIIGPAVSIAKNEEVYRIMLARVLMKQNTQMLFIPIELMTYFAIKYNDYGVGASLLDKIRNLNSLRAMLLFSRTMAQIKNSIGRTKVNIKLDPQDPNPQKTIETAMHEVAKTRQQGFPLGINNAGDLVDWVQKSGIEYGFEGHPGLPDASIEFSEHNANYAEPGNELSEDLRKSAIMATGLSPETVDNGFQADFATTVVANNLLLSKRVKKIQEIFVPQITDHCRKVSLHNAYIFGQIKEIIQDNLKKITDIDKADPIVVEYRESNPDLLAHLLTLEFLSNFEINLAQPDTAALKNQQEAFDAQEGMLDKAINYYISTNILPSSMSGEGAAERVDEVKEIVKAYFMRQWMNENHILPELSQLGSTDEDGQPVLDFGTIFTNHINAMSKSIVSLLKNTVPVGQSADKDIETLTGGNDLGASEVVETNSGSDNKNESDDFGGFGGSEDALGGDDGLPILDDI